MGLARWAVAVSLTGFILNASAASAALTLTAAGQAGGFQLSTFASGFSNNGGLGPNTIAFDSSGGVFVQVLGGLQVQRFANDDNGQVAANAPIVPGMRVTGFANLGTQIYASLPGNVPGGIGAFNQNGTLNHTLGLSTVGAFLVADNLTGHLLQSVNDGIIDVDPATGAAVSIVTVPNTSFDELAVSPDGKTVYANRDNNGHIYGFDIATHAQVFDSGAISGDAAVGLASGTGSLSNFLFINGAQGKLYELNLTTKALTVIASGGSHGYDLTADPHDGSLLVTQTDSILRLTAPQGGGFTNGGIAPATTVPLPTAAWGGLFAVAVALVVARLAPGTRPGSSQKRLGR